jgi:hypothetical protein
LKALPKKAPRLTLKPLFKAGFWACQETVRLGSKSVKAKEESAKTEDTLKSKINSEKPEKFTGCNLKRSEWKIQE